jgi:hypothetical protein
VRAAKSGNWQSALSEASVRKIEQAWGVTIAESGIRTHQSLKLDRTETDSPGLFFPESDTSFQSGNLCSTVRRKKKSLFRSSLGEIRRNLNSCRSVNRGNRFLESNGLHTFALHHWQRME